MRRCTCIPATYWQPGENPPDCPEHPWDEETGQPLPRWEPDYDPDDAEEDASEPAHDSL